jgi:hypothetical protein
VTEAMGKWYHSNWVWRTVAAVGVVMLVPPLLFFVGELGGLLLAVAGLLCFWITLVRSGRGALLWGALWMLLAFDYYSTRTWFGSPFFSLSGLLDRLPRLPLLIIPAFQIWVAWKARDYTRSREQGISPKRGLALSGLQVACVAVVLASVLTAKGLDYYGTPINLHVLSDDTGIDFPPGVRLIDARDVGFQDAWVLAKLEIDRRDIAKLIKQLPSPQRVSRDYLRVGDEIHGAPRGWAPSGAQRVIHVTAEKKGCGFNILISADDHRRSTVFMEYWLD